MKQNITSIKGELLCHVKEKEVKKVDVKEKVNKEVLKWDF